MPNIFSKTVAVLVCTAAVCVTVPAFGQQCHNGQCQMPDSFNSRGQLSRPGQQVPVTWPDSTFDRLPFGASFDGSRTPLDRRPAYSGTALEDQRHGGTPYRNSGYETSTYGTSSFQAPDPRDRGLQPTSYRNDVASVRWESDFRTGVQHSLQSRLPLLVQVSADWCGYCQKMKRDTLVDPTVMRNLNRAFVSVMLDADANRELVQQLKVKSLPTTLVILPNGRIVEHLNGYQSAAAMQTMLNRYQQRVELDTDRRVASR